MTSISLIDPQTGELIDVPTAGLEVIAGLFDSITQAEADLRSRKRDLSDEIAQRLDREGRRSVKLGGYVLEVNAPTAKTWDMDELRGTLAELVEEGTLTERKAKACIKFEPKAVWKELATLLTDPRCQARIAHCFSEEPATRSARVKRA